MDGLVGSDLGVHLVEHLALQFFLNLRQSLALGPTGLWADDGFEHVVAFEHSHLLHPERVGREVLFQFLGVDVLAVGEDYHLLLASSDEEVSLFVHVA